jgi:hypothetical protein
MRPGQAAEPRRVVAYSLFWGRARGRGYGGRRHRLAEYEYGLWRAVRTARRAGWGVRVYHDGSVERVLRRMRVAFPLPALRCVRVTVAPDLRGRRYLACLFRLLPADDPRVDVFLSRDLDDALDADGLRRVASDWADRRGAGFHYQRERYDTPERRRMANMGWFGQRRAPRTATPSVAAAIVRFARGAGARGTDYYTADEVFLTDVWIPALRRAGARGARLPSHPYRRGFLRRARRSAAFRRFRARDPAPRPRDGPPPDERVHLA